MTSISDKFVATAIDMNRGYLNIEGDYQRV